MSDTETPASEAPAPEPFSAAADMTPATATDPYAAANVAEPAAPTATEAAPGAPAYATTADVEAMLDKLKQWVRKEVDLSNCGLDNSDRETQNP